MSILVNDLPIRIKNGYLAKRDTIVARWSKISENIVAVLKSEKYISDYEVITDEGNEKKDMVITLRYENRKPAVVDVKLVSKPGRRVYKKVSEIKPILGGLGVAIISTPSGVMTDIDARSKQIGGEVLFEIW